MILAMTPGSSWALLLSLIAVVAVVVATKYRRDVAHELEFGLREQYAPRRFVGIDLAVDEPVVVIVEPLDDGTLRIVESAPWADFTA